MINGRACSRRQTLTALLLLLAMASLSTRFSHWTMAQEGNQPAPAAAEAPPAAPAAEGAKPAEGAKGAAPGEGTQIKSPFWWIIESSGLIGAFIFLLSIYFVALVVRLFLEFRPDVLMPPELVQACEEKVEQKDFQGVYDLVSEDASYFGTVLSTGIAELSHGLPEAREAMERTGEALTAEMEKKISMLAVLGTLGPMIGLLGTLKGMIGSFSVIALHDTQLKSSEVAGGISEALILTFEGVALSVPAIYFFAVFRNRLSILTINTMLKADEFLRHFAHAAKKKPAPAGQPVASAAKA
jgi:biopolymer transport protein ExbB